MRPIAIVNQKGGVGKTTTAVNIAAALARAGQRVLLIDLDPQAHASLHLGVETADDEPSVYDVLVSGTSVLETLREIEERLFLIPASLDLVASELELAQRAGRETILRNAVTPLFGEIDYCIIDCAPSLGVLSINALATAREVIIPLQPHFLALQGLGKLLETVTLVRDRLNPQLRVSGILLSMFESGTRLAAEVTRDVEEFFAAATPDQPWHGAKVFDTRIRRNIKLAECPSFGQTIFTYAAASHGAEDYMALAQEIMAMTPPTASAHADDVAAPPPAAEQPTESSSAPQS